MPSQNTYRNMAEMKFIYEQSISDVTDQYLDTSRIDVADKYFYYDSTLNYFPTLYFDKDHVPTGNSTTYCIYLKFIEKDDK